MLFNDAKNNALAIHKKTVDKYNSIYNEVQRSGEGLYELRKKSIVFIEISENHINSIANSPKDFNSKLIKIEAEKVEFQNTERYAEEACQKAIESGVGVAIGVGAGAAFVAMVPNVLMWVATTFGHASTGTAIASLHGAVAANAALAYLGGGALAAGGAGMAGGQALLALAGPVGWGLAAAAAGGNALMLGRKNKQIASKTIEEAKTITIAGANLKETGASINQIADKTKSLFALLENQLKDLRSTRYSDYNHLTSDEQLQLGALVNNTLSLSEMLNKTVS